MVYCKWVYFQESKKMGIFFKYFYPKINYTQKHYISDSKYAHFFKIMGIFELVYKIYPLLQMSIFFANGYDFSNIAKKRSPFGG